MTKQSISDGNQALNFAIFRLYRQKIACVCYFRSILTENNTNTDSVTPILDQPPMHTTEPKLNPDPNPNPTYPLTVYGVADTGRG